jgi:hypothetical protein
MVGLVDEKLPNVKTVLLEEGAKNVDIKKGAW